MSRKNKYRSVTYDPSTNDPTDVQLDAFGEDLDIGSMSAEELADTKSVRLLLFNRRNILLQYKKATFEIDELEKEKTQLSTIKENLRVKLARKDVYRNIGYIEIIISALLGFSLNMIFENVYNEVGWIILVTSLVVLLITTIGIKRQNNEQ